MSDCDDRLLRFANDNLNQIHAGFRSVLTQIAATQGVDLPDNVGVIHFILGEANDEDQQKAIRTALSRAFGGRIGYEWEDCYICCYDGECYCCCDPYFRPGPGPGEPRPAPDVHQA